MPKLEYFIVSEGASTDIFTNRVSLFNVVEQIKSKDFPVVLPQVVATTAWNKEAADTDLDFQASLRIYSPGEERPKEFPINFKMERSRHRLHQTIIYLQVTQVGDLVFEILLNGEHVASHTVTVEKEEA